MEMEQGFYFLIRVRRIFRNNKCTVVTGPPQPFVGGNIGKFICNFL